MRDRFEAEGADGFKDHELLEMFLFDIIPRANTNPIAHRLLDRFETLDGVMRASEAELCTVDGIGPKTAKYIKEKWISACGETEAKLRGLPMVSFERASNFLIWHRFTGCSEGMMTVVLLDCNMFITCVCDMERESDELPEDAYANAENALLGIPDGMKSGDYRHISEALASKGITLVDVICVEGFTAESKTK